MPHLKKSLKLLTNKVMKTEQKLLQKLDVKPYNLTSNNCKKISKF